MEDTVEIVLSFLLAVIVLFIFPIYIAYEKKDDLAYALATKYVSDFVEEVKIKGYVSLDMYQKLQAKLEATDNRFDIYMEHKAKKVYPSGNGGYTEAEEIYTEKQILEVLTRYAPFDDASKINQKENEKYKLFCKISDISEQQDLKSKNVILMQDIYGSLKIEDIPVRANMFYVDSNDVDENHISSIYTMNIGDEFNIRIKNSNVTIAASLFNTFTANGYSRDTTRVYVNYGAIITGEKYW